MIEFFDYSHGKIVILLLTEVITLYVSFLLVYIGELSIQESFP